MHKEIEEAYVNQQNEVKVIDDVDEETVSDEPIIAEQPKNIVKVNSASRTFYKGRVALLRWLDTSVPNSACEVYIGKSENYDDRGNYDNSDDSLILVSKNENMFSLIRDSHWVVSQQQFIESGDFTDQDYKEFYELKNGLLKDMETTGEILFSVDINDPNSGVPFRYPNWQDEKAPVEQTEAEPQLTPFYKEYLTVQEKYPKAIVMTRLGDFYEMLDESARTAADELDLTLTGRNVGLPERAPMCGVPYHAVDAYIEKLLQNHPVVIVEGKEEPKYIMSHAEALAQSEKAQEPKPELIEMDDDGDSPFDADEQFVPDENDEQPDYVGDIDTRFPIDDDYGDEEDEPETDYDEFDDEQEEEDEEKVRPQVKAKQSKPIQSRKRKEKPQMSLFDLIDGKSQKKTPEEQVKEWALKYGLENRFAIYEQYATNPDEREFISFVKEMWGTSYGAYLGDREFQCSSKGIAAAFKDREHPENNVVVKFTWAQYAIDVADLIDEEDYFTPEEKAKYDKFYAERHGSNEERIKAIADHAIERGLKHDDGGIYDMWESWLYAGPLFFKEHRAEIEAELNSRNEILNATCVDGKISMLFDHEYLITKESKPHINSGVVMPAEPKTDEKRIQALADFMVKKGTQETSEGNYIFYFDEIPEDKEFIYDHAEAIRDEIESRVEVADVYALGDVDGDCFDITYYLDYCPNLEEETVKDIYSENTDLNAIGFDQSELGGAKARFKSNLEAIRLLSSLYDEDRLANGAERKILAKYVGWGGLAKAFDERDENWRSEYAELISTLDPEDYEKAKGSVLNAHYTSKEVIDGIYKALARFGVKGNNRILEPAMGTGNFFGYMPKEIRENARLYGVELDNITGKIATKLYPKANVQIKGFEQTTFSNNHFDIVVGNVPFGAYTVYDSEYARQNFYIHDYFLAKSIDKLKPNGLMAVITSTGTMDKLNPTVRKYLAERAELIGAIRLPNNAFQKTAGTQVVSDILFFKKREEKAYVDTENTEWLSTAKTKQGYEINNYFIKHPEMVLGQLVMEHGMYGALDVTVKPDGRNLTDALDEAVSRLPENFYITPEYTESAEEESAAVDYDVKPLCFKAENGRLYMRVGDSMVEQTIPSRPADAYERICEMINLRNELRYVLDIQTDGCSDEKLKAEQRTLNANYDRFVRRFGILNSQTNTRLFKDDGDSALLFACENLSDDKKTATKADVFSKRTIRPYSHFAHKLLTVLFVQVVLACNQKFCVRVKVAKLVRPLLYQVIRYGYHGLFSQAVLPKFHYCRANRKGLAASHNVVK